MFQVPIVSIGMPVYNGERFLSEALDGILGQTFDDFELIISDNASTDRTESICRTYAAKDPRIRFVRNETNMGASANYKSVFRLAKGRYFRWAPADDLFAPESLEVCVETLNEHPEAVLCYPKTTLIDEYGAAIRSYEDHLHLPLPSPVERFKRVLKQIGLANCLYGLIRREALGKTALLGNYPGADIVLILELSLLGQFIEIPRPLFFRRMHPAASSSIQTVEGTQEFFDPKTKGRPFMRGWRHLFEEEKAILRVPLSWKEKCQLSYVVARFAIASRHTLLEEICQAARTMVGQALHFD